MSVEIGQQAPNFTLPNAQGQPVSLESLRGKTTILAFFPFAFSSVCTEEMCTFRDALAELNDANAQVIGISVDSPHALRAFGEAQGLRFPLLSDFNKEASSAGSLRRFVASPGSIGRCGLRRKNTNDRQPTLEKHGSQGVASQRRGHCSSLEASTGSWSC